MHLFLKNNNNKIDTTFVTSKRAHVLLRGGGGGGCSNNEVAPIPRAHLAHLICTRRKANHQSKPGANVRVSAPGLVLPLPADPIIPHD